MDGLKDLLDLKKIDKAEFKEQLVDINQIEQSLKFAISNNQEIIEYSPSAFKLFR